MTLFLDIRKKLHRYFLKQKVSELTNLVKPINYDSAREIIILYNAESIDQNVAVREYSRRLLKEKKSVNLLGFTKKIPADLAEPARYLSNADLNWIMNPRPARVGKILKTKFDLLINFYQDECLPLEYIAALSHAKFKVGRYQPDKTYCYDLMLQLKDSDNIEEFIDQVDHYLKYINPHEN